MQNVILDPFSRRGGTLLAKSIPDNFTVFNMKNFDGRACNGDRLSIVFFGGSLTWGAQATDPGVTSYRARMARKFEEKYPKAHFDFWDAAIGGTGSQLGAFRLDRDVLARNPDLVFLDFTINDDPFSPPHPDKLASYESIVRRLVQAGVAVVQVIFAVKKDLLPVPPQRPLDTKHKEIARAYNLPIADVVATMQKRVAEKTADPEKLWDVADDPTHPGDGGYVLYAEGVWDTYLRAVKEGQEGHLPQTMVSLDTYTTLKRERLALFPELPAGWERMKPNRTGICYDFLPSRWMDELVVAAAGNNSSPALEPFRLAIRGRNIMLFGESTPHTGKYQVSIDGEKPKVYDSGGELAKSGNLRYFEIIAQGLDAEREHLLVITPQLDSGQELRLESVCVAGAPATVSSL